MDAARHIKLSGFFTGLSDEKEQLPLLVENLKVVKRGIDHIHIEITVDRDATGSRERTRSISYFTDTSEVTTGFIINLYRKIQGIGT